MNSRRIIPLALAAGALAVPAVAQAHDSSHYDSARSDDYGCLRYDHGDAAPIAYAIAGNVLTVTPRSAEETLRVKLNRKRGLKVTRSGNAYSLDLKREEGESFAAVQRYSRNGKLRLRVVAKSAEGERLRAYEVEVKAYSKVAGCDDQVAGDDHGRYAEPGDDHGVHAEGEVHHAAPAATPTATPVAAPVRSGAYGEEEHHGGAQHEAGDDSSSGRGGSGGRHGAYDG